MRIAAVGSGQTALIQFAAGILFSLFVAEWRMRHRFLRSDLYHSVYWRLSGPRFPFSLRSDLLSRWPAHVRSSPRRPSLPSPPPTCVGAGPLPKKRHQLYVHTSPLQEASFTHVRWRAPLGQCGVDSLYCFMGLVSLIAVRPGELASDQGTASFRQNSARNN